MRSKGSADDHAVPKDNVDLLSQMGYENRDISLNAIITWIVGLFGFIAVVTGATILLYNFFVPPGVELERVSPLASVRRLPPYPQLQTAPKRDMIEYRQAEDAILTTVTKGREGQANLPIPDAIDAVANRGISGISGTGESKLSPAYPGSGNYNVTPDRANNGGTGDVTDYSPTTALHDAATGASGIGSANASPTPAPAGPQFALPVSVPVSGPVNAFDPNRFRNEQEK